MEEETPKAKKLYAKADDILTEASRPERLRDNPFKGRPLPFEPANPYDKGMRMANRMLKNAGYKPPWIDTRESIIAEKKALRRAMSEHLDWLGHAVSLRQAGRMQAAELRAAHERFLDHLRDRIEKLRREILRFNLEVPVLEQQIVNVSFDTFTEEMRLAARALLGTN